MMSHAALQFNAKMIGQTSVTNDGNHPAALRTVASLGLKHSKPTKLHSNSRLVAIQAIKA